MSRAEQNKSRSSNAAKVAARREMQDEIQRALTNIEVYEGRHRKMVADFQQEAQEQIKKDAEDEVAQIVIKIFAEYGVKDVNSSPIKVE
jgi:hypothetical protein